MSARESKLPPGPRLPRLLQASRWLFAPIPFMRSCADRYGDPFTVRMFSQPPMVFFTEPAAIRQIFTGDPHQFHAGQAMKVFELILGPNSLLLLDESRHKRERKLLMPPFHGARMRLYGEMMWEIADRSIDGRTCGTTPRCSTRRGSRVDGSIRMRSSHSAAAFATASAPRLPPTK